MNKLTKILSTGCLVGAIGLGMMGCNEAERVTQSLQQEADNFNVVRQVTVIDCITGETMF